MKLILGYGFIMGGICFLLGLVGPNIFAPEANQGPLLGIFITGPLGFILSLIIGGVVASRRKRNPEFKHPLRRFID